ncbi:MAG TPA: heparan-alpha-glucosaminide N-acetyltransferase domain-containing protein [Vicinamibacteria bacterium]|nr:heparan-alpha-glucosaminide N-acetyltransferase domain-containing protein [Vicinamibacteria bacterium]
MSAASVAAPAFVERRRQPRGNREIYIDAFRGVMALLMVQGHIFDDLVSAADRAAPWYQFEVMFHGSTAPGFLFASGFVAGLPRAPLSLRASVRRARRLLFVLGVGYFLHLPYLSIWKTVQATPAQKAELFACNPLQLIAVSQLGLLALQWIAGRRWVVVAAAAAVGILAGAPFVWSAALSTRVPLWLGGYLDPAAAPSQFPVFPFASFVLAGTVAGAWLGRTDRATRHRRSVRAALVLVAAGVLVSILLSGHVDFWSVSPGYALLRMGGLVLVLAAVEWAAAHHLPGIRPLGLIGHETLVVYFLHLVLLFGGVIGHSPLSDYAGRLGFGGALVVLLAMLPVLYVAAWTWHRFKMRRPHAAHLVLSFVTVLVLWEFLTRPW